MDNIYKPIAGGDKAAGINSNGPSLAFFLPPLTPVKANLCLTLMKSVMNEVLLLSKLLHSLYCLWIKTCKPQVGVSSSCSCCVSSRLVSDKHLLCCLWLPPDVLHLIVPDLHFIPLVSKRCLFISTFSPSHHKAACNFWFGNAAGLKPPLVLLARMRRFDAEIL